MLRDKWIWYLPSFSPSEICFRAWFELLTVLDGGEIEDEIARKIGCRCVMNVFVHEAAPHSITGYSTRVNMLKRWNDVGLVY